MATETIKHWGDILVVLVYFFLVLLVGVWSLCRPNRGTVKSYFLAGRSMTWIPVGASLFSSNIGSEHFVGLAGTGAASGIAIVMYEWLAFPLLCLTSWIFVPVYVASGVYTMPEYMTKRFGGQRIRLYLSVLSMILYIVTKLAVCIFAGALFIQMSMGWNMYLSIAVLLIITGLFTILGGLAAVIYTDTFQTGIMILGGIILAAIGFNKIGGFTNFEAKYMNSTASIRDANSTCGLPRHDAFHILRDPVSSDNPWPGVILHIMFGVVWYFCCDQVMVQRTLAARTLSHAKGGAVLSGYLKILPMFLMIMPGMISRVLFPDEVACVDPDECLKHCGNPVGCSNIAYPKLVLELLPTGLRGLLVAVMLSAIMSSMTSIFNSASTLFTMDIWPKIRKSASEKELLIVGRVFILVMCFLSILWIPLVKSSKSGQLFVYIQAVQGYLGTPIGPVFIFAIFWHRMSEKAAFWSLVIGHTCGVTRMVLDFSMPAPECGEPETRPAVLYQVHYTYFGIISFSITSLSIVIISYFTEPSARIKSMTWWTRYDDVEPKEEIERSCVEERSVTGAEIYDDRPMKKAHVSLKPGSTEERLSHPPLLEMTSFPGRDPETSLPTAMVSEQDEDTVVLPLRANYEKEKSKVVVLAYKLCGIPLKATVDISENREAIHKGHFLKENSFWKGFLDFNFVVGCMVIVFLIGYYH